MLVDTQMLVDLGIASKHCTPSPLRFVYFSPFGTFSLVSFFDGKSCKMKKNICSPFPGWKTQERGCAKDFSCHAALMKNLRHQNFERTWNGTRDKKGWEQLVTLEHHSSCFRSYLGPEVRSLNLDTTCCVFWPAFRCCAHPKAGRNLFSAVFQPFLFISKLFQVSTSFWVRAAPESWSKYTTTTLLFLELKNCDADLKWHI